MCLCGWKGRNNERTAQAQQKSDAEPTVPEVNDRILGVIE